MANETAATTNAEVMDEIRKAALTLAKRVTMDVGLHPDRVHAAAAFLSVPLVVDALTRAPKP